MLAERIVQILSNSNAYFVVGPEGFEPPTKGL